MVIVVVVAAVVVVVILVAAVVVVVGRSAGTGEQANTDTHTQYLQIHFVSLSTQYTHSASSVNTEQLTLWRLTTYMYK